MTLFSFIIKYGVPGITCPRNYGITRGYARGQARRYARGLTRGYARGLTRGYVRGLTRGFTMEEIIDLSRKLPEFEEHESELEPAIGSLSTTIAAISPPRTGLAANPRPVFHWYISAPWPGNIEFTLNREGQGRPVIQSIIAGP